MAQIFKNNVWGQLASELAAGATTATLNAGHGFTDPGTDWYLATLIGVTGTTETAWEIVKVTDVSTNTLTIERAQESTADATWPVGTRIEARLTAGATESKANLGAAAYKAVGTGSGDVAAGDHDHASTYQPLDSDLTALAGLSTTGLIERTGDGTAGIVTITTAGKAILDDANAAAQRTTLGIGGFSQDGSGNFTRIVPGGSTEYPDFPCRAWGYIDGAAATPTISGGNVSSITDLGTGSYRITLTSALDSSSGALVAMDDTYGGWCTVHGYTISSSQVELAVVNASNVLTDTKFYFVWVR